MITLAFALFATICLFGIISNVSENDNVERILYGLTALLLIAFAGLREVGSDQDSIGYLNYYNMSDDVMSLVAEPTFVIIANLTRSISAQDGFTYLLLIYAIIGISLKLYAIRKLTNLYWLALITYFSYFFLLHDFTQIRAAVASALILISIKAVYDRKPLVFIVLIGTASLFHYSAIAAFPLYFLSNRKLTRFGKWLVAMAVPVGVALHFSQVDLTFVFPIELIDIKVRTYAELESTRDVQLNVFNAVYLVKYALVYVFLYYGNRISAHSAYFPILIKIYGLSMFSYLALSFNSTFAMRISELLGIVEIVLIPLMYYAFRERVMGVVFVVVLAIGNLLLALYQSELIQTSLA